MAINAQIRSLLLGAAALALIAGCESVREYRDAELKPPIQDVTETEDIKPGSIVTDADLLNAEAAGIPQGQLPQGITPMAYRLDLKTDPAADRFSGSVSIDVMLDEGTDTIYLHALGPVIESAAAIYEGDIAVPAEFEGDLAPGGVSRLTFASDLPAGKVTLNMTYDAPYNFGLAGLYKAFSDGTPYLASQMEAIDARRAFPSFDEPRFKTPWTLTVTAPAGNKVIANAPEVSTTELEDGWVRHEFAPTRPIQSYLVALAVGPYDELIADAIPANDIRDREVPFRSFAAAGKGDQLREATDTTYDLLSIQEEYFDYPYPYAKLDLIAAPDFAYGAMENAGAIVYRESALLINERTSLSRKRRIFVTHAHELAHQWFGNLVTPAWWDDIWLNEAFATWMAYKTMHAYDPEGGFDRQPTVRGLGAMGSDSLASARQIRNPINSNGDILSAFDGITYSKGGHVLAMFENYLGEEAFREGMRLHMRRFEDGVADVNDFMTSLADGANNPGVVPAFRSFIFQPGIPFLDVAVSCPIVGQTATVTVTQERYAPLGSTISPDASWIVPFSMIASIDGERVQVSKLLEDQTTEIRLEEGCPDWVLPNSGGKGYWRFNTSEENWDALSQNYSDLSAGEQLIFGDSLVAGFRAGEVSADAMLAGLTATTGGSWDAVNEPLGDVASLVGLAPEGEAQDLMLTWVSDTYKPLYTELVERDDLSQGETLLLQQLYRTLIDQAKDPVLGEEVRQKALAYVGLKGGEPDGSALPVSELTVGIGMGLSEDGSDFFNAALAVAKVSENQFERRNIYNALANRGSLEDVSALLDTTLTGEFQGQEALFIYYAAIGNDEPAVSDSAWEHFKTNFEDLIDRIPEVRKPQVPSIAGSFCEATAIDAAEAFFNDKADLIPGYERPLAQGVERGRLCAALNEAKAGELAAALLEE
ncbi:MAG: M1 family metallopeptidase [Pseudomonadota bacterium]